MTLHSVLIGALLGAILASVLYLAARFASAYTARGAWPVEPADCIVVLGAAVWPGGRPSDVLAGRLRRAAELYRSGLAPVVICTGGLGAIGPAEAEVGKRLLEADGIDSGAVLVEDRSRSTAEQAGLVAEMLRERDWRTAIVVTSAFHAPRALLLFRGRGVDARDGSVDHAGLRHRTRLAAREAGALLALEWWWTVAGALAGAVAAVL